MKTKTQSQIAERAGIAQSYISLILNGHRRPSWPVAKRLAKVTCTEPVLWLDGTVEQMREALEMCVRAQCDCDGYENRPGESA